jgi:hypothetical protein
VSFFLGIAAWATSFAGAGLSGRRIAAMVVNDKACGLDKRGALEGIASKLDPAGMALALLPGIA